MSTALVLSAGGMFGSYQAGAYQAIAERTTIDLVIGVSVGALNGYAIASGCSPADLISRWRDPSAGQTLRLLPNAGWRRGWFDPAGLHAQTERLVREFTPKIPFAVGVVEVRTLRTRLICCPEVTALHLAASCSIPFLFPAVKIGNRLYMDGGLFDKLPVSTAVAMGATRIIAIDSLPRIGPWWLAAGIDVAHVFAPSRTVPSGVDLKTIVPSQSLGDARDAVNWKRENVDRWVALGYRDAQKTLIM